MLSRMINVTKSFFPPLIEYEKQLEKIWKNNWLTNRGALVIELEEKLKDYLDVPDILIMANGTLAMQIALRVLAKKGEVGEVITTPFSYIATTSAILWENFTPVFVDIHPEYLTIDEQKISACITKNTIAILATHVFGNPCAVEEIEGIAKKYNLYVIYDGAHCFNVSYKEQSIFNYGDISTTSFHATKLFHTGEGGAVFCKDKTLMHNLFYTHSFGHNGPSDYFGLGTNAKISELHAAMGLTVLPYIKDEIVARTMVVNFYNDHLDFSKLKKLKIREGTTWNYSYYPVIFENINSLLKVQEALNLKNIFPRRYFYPSLNSIPYIHGKSMPISESISERVLCLPLYGDLNSIDLKLISETLNSALI